MLAVLAWKDRRKVGWVCRRRVVVECLVNGEVLAKVLNILCEKKRDKHPSTSGVCEVWWGFSGQGSASAPKLLRGGRGCDDDPGGKKLASKALCREEQGGYVLLSLESSNCSTTIPSVLPTNKQGLSECLVDLSEERRPSQIEMGEGGK